VTGLLASIPSPSEGVIELGPFTLRAYGLMLLLGIVAATWLLGRRAVRAGDATWDFVFSLAMWGVAGGIVGARLYHVVTSWDEVPDPKLAGIFEVWKGGLGIWGGIAGGVIAGAIVVRRSGKSVFRFLDHVAPALLLAQAIGRWGNWFNQELYGEPTDLPWGLEISPDERPAEFAGEDTFHPIFLYESIWNFIGVGVLLAIERRWRIRPPGLFCLYVVWYCLARVTFEENLRIDPSADVLGFRLNFWVALAILLAAAGAFVWAQRRAPDQPTAPGPGRPAPAGPKFAVPKGRGRSGR
jgi:prolipoprotein diacylglyceryl transferase